jgi:hypothetical protein
MRERTLARALHVDTERPCDATRAALTTGQLTTPQAEVIARAMRQLLPDDVLNLEPTVAAACVAAAPSAADRICRHAVLVAGDDAALRREERAHASRHLHVSPCGDMVRVDGMLPGLEGATVLAALDALARPTADETTPGNGSPRRSHGQRMADALTELARRQLNAGELPIHGGLRPNVHVTVTLHDLLAGTGTARIEGRSHAAVTAIAASRLACDAELDWAITGEQAAVDSDVDSGVDPNLLARLLADLAPALGGSTPAILAAGRTSRLVTPAQRKALIHCDRGCTYPGCDRPPEWCDAHHLREWGRDRGPTDLQNLALVCQFHHTRLHVNGETLVRGPAGYERIAGRSVGAVAAGSPWPHP